MKSLPIFEQKCKVECFNFTLHKHQTINNLQRSKNSSLLTKNYRKMVLVFISLFLINMNDAVSQEQIPPIPVEVFFGHDYLYYQFVTKKPFSPSGKFDFFALATYSADYRNDLASNSMVIIGQVSFELGRGFGLMVGTDVNSFSGFTPVFGPQHTYASKKWLAVTVLSSFLNEDRDLKLFGLYEYKPVINDKWTFYNRVQFIFNQSMRYESHNKSYIYLRTGLKRNKMTVGLAANLDWSGTEKTFRENYGLFTRWEF
jgi:hypothetical protein